MVGQRHPKQECLQSREQAHRNETVNLEGCHNVKGAPAFPSATSGRCTHARHFHSVRPANVQQALALPEHVALQLVMTQTAQIEAESKQALACKCFVAFPLASSLMNGANLLYPKRAQHLDPLNWRDTGAVTC